MKRQLITFVIGLAAGVAAMLTVGLLDEGSQVQENPALVTPQKGDVVDDCSVPSVVTAELDSEEGPINSGGETRPEFQSSVPEIRMPSNYQEMIGPVRTQPTTLAEMHANFASEPRVESWAIAMETGINDYIANSSPRLGVVVEYVECRSRTCEIAGYRIDGESDRTASLRMMVQEPWWQGGRKSYLGGHWVDGVDYFVTIFYEGN